MLTSLYIICSTFKASNTLQLHRKLVSFWGFCLIACFKMFSSYALLFDLSILISLWLLMLWLLLLLAMLLLLLLRLVLLGFGFSLARKVAGSYYPKNFTPEGNTNKGVAQHSCLTMKWLGPAALRLSVCVRVCVHGVRVCFAYAWK